MSVAFEKAFNHVLKSEGKFSNDPADSGGATMWGITHDEINKFLGHVATIDGVKAFPIESAKIIYKTKYWDAMKLDQLENELLKILIFDQGVNRGCGTAIKSIQKLISVTPDGVMGPNTIAKIRSVNPLLLCFNFIKDAQIVYANIVKRNPTQIVFLVGWLNRTHKLLDLVRDNVGLV